MKLNLLLAVSILFISNCFAQDSTTVNAHIGKPFTAHVYKMDGSVLKGYLYEASTSSITITPGTKAPYSANTLSPEQIDKLFLRRKGSVGIGGILGAIGGTAIGVIIGAASPYDEDCWGCLAYSREDNMIIGGIVGFFSGIGVGMIIGTLTKKKFIIHGKKENYQLKYPAIVERAMIQH